MEQRKVEELLRERIGLDPRSAGPSLVRRAINARMSALKLNADDHAHYLQRLGEDRAEQQALIEEVVVPESWFFRDEHPFRFLAEKVAGRWILDRSLPPLRVLSIPCAGGEEPYSIAMTLLDAGLLSERFRIVAVDVSTRSLDAARRGRYTANAFRTKDLRFRDRYFQPAPEGFQVDDALRRSVSFRPGNLLDAALLRDEASFDVVFCRNLLIYFDDAARSAAVANLLRLVSEGGVLILGHADPSGVLPGGEFERGGEASTFAFRRRRGGQVAESPLRTNRAEPARPIPKKPAPKHPGLTDFPRKPLPAPVTRVDTSSQPHPIAKPPAPEKELDPLVQARELADQGRHDEAEAACQRAIAIRPTAAAFGLLGMLHQAAGRRDDAERNFEKAVYLDNNHEESLLALALIAQRRGDADRAAMYRRRAARAAEEGRKP